MVTKVQVNRRRFTVDDYHRMAAAGILTEDDRVELVDGEIVQMSPIGSRHAACVNRLNRILNRRIGDIGVVSVQNPVGIDAYGEPQPDLAVLRPREDYYDRELPTPADVLLLVEVADTSLEYDRNAKLPLYARSQVPEALLVDLTGQIIERHTDPTEGGYRLVARARRGESLESVAIPSLILEVDVVLG